MHDLQNVTQKQSYQRSPVSVRTETKVDDNKSVEKLTDTEPNKVAENVPIQSISDVQTNSNGRQSTDRKAAHQRQLPVKCSELQSAPTLALAQPPKHPSPTMRALTSLEAPSGQSTLRQQAPVAGRARRKRGERSRGKVKRASPENSKI